MDLNSFFLGAGFALFIALLAWGDRIRRPRDDIAQLERDYILHLKKKKSQVLPVLRPPSQYSFINQMSAVIDFFVNDRLSDKDLLLRKQIIELRSKGESLEFWFDVRYYSVVAFILTSFLFGVLSSFNGKDYFELTESFCITFNSLYLTLFLFFVIGILTCLIVSSEREKGFIKSLNNSLDNMEE